MKKLAVLIIGGFLLMACDATPGGNKAIMPVEHEESMDVDHHGHHGTEAHDEHEHATTETDSTQNTAAEVPVSEPVKTDSAQ